MFSWFSASVFIIIIYLAKYPEGSESVGPASTGSWSVYTNIILPVCRQDILWGVLILSDQIKTNIKPESSHAITDWTLSMILVSKEINLLLPPGCFVVSKVRHSSLLMPVFAVFLYLLTLLISAVRVSLVRIRTCWCDHI